MHNMIIENEQNTYDASEIEYEQCWRSCVNQIRHSGIPIPIFFSSR
jgi:hypothetical protein